MEELMGTGGICCNNASTAVPAQSFAIVPDQRLRAYMMQWYLDELQLLIPSRPRDSWNTTVVMPLLCFPLVELADPSVALICRCWCAPQVVAGSQPGDDIVTVRLRSSTEYNALTLGHGTVQINGLKEEAMAAAIAPVGPW